MFGQSKSMLINDLINPLYSGTWHDSVAESLISSGCWKVSLTVKPSLSFSILLCLKHFHPDYEMNTDDQFVKIISRLYKSSASKKKKKSNPLSLWHVI